MANIRIKDLPADSAPKADDKVPIDLGTTRNTTVEEFVFAGRPTATKTEAETGTDNKKAMTPLAVKQAIDAQTGMRYVPVTRRVDSGTGLSGGQELTGDVTLSLNAASIASLAKADSAVQSVNGKSGNSVTITPADVGAAPSSIVADVNANTAERHSHTNKAILDATTASFLATEKTKLSDIESGAQVNTVNSVNTKTGSVVLNASDVGAAPDTVITDINANTAARHTHSNKAILDATTSSFLAADKTKLTGIEAGAQVNTVTSVAGKTGAVDLVKGDVGLGNVDNTSDASKPVSTATQTALNAKANSSVTVSAGTGLTGGGNLTANRSIALNSSSIASLGKADTALQAPGGTTGQILAKSSNTTNDVGWVSSEAATAVSYGPQTLTEPQKTQARSNIGAVIASEVTKSDVGLGNVANKSEAQMVASGPIADAISSSGLSVGSVIMMASDDTIVPPGYLLMNGSSVTATYPELRAYGIAAGWALDGSGNPIIPDMGGYFARGWRPGQSIDSGRVFGSIQQDALQNITGSAVGGGAYGFGYFREFNGALAGDGGQQKWKSQTTSADPELRFDGLKFDASLVARTADETRPINRTFTYWVKAYPAVVDTGSINLANLTNDIQAVATSVSDLEDRTQVKLDAKAGFYTGSDAGEVNLPVGSVIAVMQDGTTSIPRNSTRTVRLRDTSGDYTLGGSLSILSGVYKCRGYAGASGSGSYIHIFQRIS